MVGRWEGPFGIDKCSCTKRSNDVEKVYDDDVITLFYHLVTALRIYLVCLHAGYMCPVSFGYPHVLLCVAQTAAFNSSIQHNTVTFTLGHGSVLICIRIAIFNTWCVHLQDLCIGTACTFTPVMRTTHGTD